MSHPQSMPAVPLLHQAVWRGQELLQCSEWNHQLMDVERQELLKLAESIKPAADGTPQCQGKAVETLSGRSDLAPVLSERLLTVQQQLEEGCGAVRITGFPASSLNEFQSRALFQFISGKLGTPVSQSAKGEKIFSVRDEGFADNDPRARGPNTKKKLSFHTDRCDVIGFLCLQPAKSGGENEVVSSMAIYNEILRRRPECLDVLSQPFHYLRHTVDQGNDRPWCRQPVFSFCEGHFACCFLRVLIERAHQHPDLPELTSEQKEALDLVEAIAGEDGMYLRFHQQSGDILFLNNWVTLHRRTEFQDDEDPAKKRHILRVWISPPNSRPIDPLFADNYGSTEAGVVRGGMKAAEISRAE